ncbi:MAG: type II secretion system GspH family protein [Armatimonadetes bacterium]|nr:type II secretion system GspH family protein [Armatimonadota bacterium]
MRTRGYTLVELLVVVAIIAMLSAMILPVLLQSREVARMRVCASNLQQLGNAIMRYMDDYDGYGLPPPPASFRNPWILCVRPLLVGKYLPQAVSPSVVKLSGALPYASTITALDRPNWLWRCHGDTNRGSAEYERPSWWAFGSSYRYPGTLVYLGAPEGVTDFRRRTGLFPRKPLMWKNHKRDILLADHYNDFHNGTRADRDPGESAFPSDSPWIKVKSVNILFLDLHVKAVTPSQRKEFQDYTIYDDNPFPPPRGKD